MHMNHSTPLNNIYVGQFTLLGLRVRDINVITHQIVRAIATSTPDIHILSAVKVTINCFGL